MSSVIEPRSESSAAGTSGAAEASAAARIVLPVALAATLLVLIAFTSAITTVGETAATLDAGISWQTWVLSAMSLGLATALLSTGALADRHGPRRILALGALGLLAASVLAAAAPTIAVFVAARVLQGVAGAAVLVATLGLIGLAFAPGPQRAHATGLWGAMVGGGILLGPLLAGALADVADWRLVHWLEAAGALGIALAAARLPDLRADRRHPLDPPGVAALAGSMAALTAGLICGRSNWTSTVTIALLAGGVVLLGLFVAIELRRSAPMLDLHLFRAPLFVAATAGSLFLGLSTIATMSYLPLMTQRALHTSVLGSAAVLAIWSGTSTVVAAQARRLPKRWDGRHPLIVGCLLCAVGLVALAFLTTDSTWVALAPGLLIVGVGSGLSNAALGRLAVEAVPPERAGMSSGASNTARYLGGAAGVALTVAIATGDGTSHADLIAGWNHAALVGAALIALGAVVAVLANRRR
ncbi:MFS transporter [Conexibacter sp. CPCC 206217]|uniref:MFS transporter n=1 Tax=Conexibacter sp. CPCC 206217 TaxID=3064574 RepID=UPI002728D2BD|nr:MFS transporter [Conexibacter sp. CPCC 206217]MDO8212392.1 MFS transporter [Conexibacter sp. CPCC 206217]